MNHWIVLFIYRENFITGYKSLIVKFQMRRKLSN